MNNLKKILFERNIKQNKMAEDIGIIATRLNNYVNGNTEPDIKTMIKIADYLNISLDFLCGRQYNNNVGYIPDDRKDSVKRLVDLQQGSFEKADSYIQALVDVDNRW